MEKPELTTAQKKLIFRAWHRGTREADLLMGRFADNYVPTASTADLETFEKLLEENDPDIYDWVIGRLPVPANGVGLLIQKLKEFYDAAR
jgi:antitoxin CptB